MIMEEMRMRNYALTIEDDVITHIADTDLNGTPIPGILHLPKEATAFPPMYGPVLAATPTASKWTQKTPSSPLPTTAC